MVEHFETILKTECVKWSNGLQSFHVSVGKILETKDIDDLSKKLKNRLLQRKPSKLILNEEWWMTVIWFKIFWMRKNFLLVQSSGSWRRAATHTDVSNVDLFKCNVPNGIYEYQRMKAYVRENWELEASKSAQNIEDDLSRTSHI